MLRFFCRACHKYFSVDTWYFDTKGILNDHLDGVSFRKLSVKYGISKSKTWEIVHQELNNLPDNNQFTFIHCVRFSSIFLFDGKYVSVKGYREKIPLLWGIDYFRHDIPIITLATNESYQAWARFFSFFRIISHHPQLLVCDDNYNLKLAARERFPAVTIQSCTNHFMENIRRQVKVRSDITYKDFVDRVKEILSHKWSEEVWNNRLYQLFQDYRTDSLAQSILLNIERYKYELLAYRGISQAPMTTNLIESFNSHLEARLFSIKGFESFAHAKLWLNGYTLKRRYTKFTGCSGKFRALNGKRSLELTKKHGVILPILF